MATCEFCKEEMKDGAIVCPHCQRTTRAEKGRKAGNFWIVIVLIVLGLLAGLIWLVNQPPPSPEERSAQAEKLAAEINERCDRLPTASAADECRYREMMALAESGRLP